MAVINNWYTKQGHINLSFAAGFHDDYKLYECTIDVNRIDNRSSTIYNHSSNHLIIEQSQGRQSFKRCFRTSINDGSNGMFGQLETKTVNLFWSSDP